MKDMGNLLLLLVEASLYFVVMAALFRARRRFGIGLFFCALGAMHFLETYLASILYVGVPGDVMLSPGSVVLFSGKLLLLLLVYIREDAATVRQPIYGLFIGNLLMVSLVLLMRHHTVAGVAPAPDFAFMDEMGWLMIWGTMLLFLDAIFIVLLYERLGSLLGNRPSLRILASSIVVLTFDQVGFFTALHLSVGLPPSAFWGGWLAKMVAAVFYSVAIGLYLIYVERPRRIHRTRVIDVFDALTYRERYERLLQATGRDALTGVFNRGHLDEIGERTVADAIAHKRPVSLLLVDIDHFKQINDVYGHAAGDEALRAIAREIERYAREGDTIYRFGGEEFVVICDGLAHTAAVGIAERIRLGVALVPHANLRQPITASIGVATAPEDGTGLGMLFASADGRLYEAKARGRNRVVGRSARTSEGHAAASAA